MEGNTQLDRQQQYHNQDHSATDIVIIMMNIGVAVVSGLVSDERSIKYCIKY